MTVVTDNAVHILVVTGPARARLYERFCAEYLGRDDVRVVLDRREGERRREARPVTHDRRRAERRRSVPWMVFPPG
jgi:hypothetical protein